MTDEPVVMRLDDGTAELRWPDGVGATLVARELVEQWVELHNAAVAVAHQNPWSWSTEGLDDCCTMCGSTSREWAGAVIHRHLDDCCWMSLCAQVGVVHLDHEFGGRAL